MTRKLTTWKDVMKNSKICCIQDPLIEIDLDKNEFNEMYMEIVCELEGQEDLDESYVEYYFNINPIKTFVLTFKGEKEKSEFYDIGLKKKSVLTLKEVHEGEDND